MIKYSLICISSVARTDVFKSVPPRRKGRAFICLDIDSFLLVCLLQYILDGANVNFLAGKCDRLIHIHLAAAYFQIDLGFKSN